jgi:hypothetical protein
MVISFRVLAVMEAIFAHAMHKRQSRARWRMQTLITALQHTSYVLRGILRNITVRAIRLTPPFPLSF